MNFSPTPRKKKEMTVFINGADLEGEDVSVKKSSNNNEMFQLQMIPGFSEGFPLSGSKIVDFER